MASKIPVEYFRERLQLVARILNLIPYEQNYYEILGVSSTATHEEIKQAFRRLSFSSHPDTNPNDPDAAERFRNIQHAYDVLRNDKLRLSYDQNLGSHTWADETVPERKTFGTARWWKWRRAWPVATLLLILVLLTLLVDYRQWQTPRHYTRLQKAADRHSAPPSVAVPKVSVKDVEEIAQDPPPTSTIESAIKPAKPPPLPESASTPADKGMPRTAALTPGVATREGESTLKSGAPTIGGKAPASLPATSFEHPKDIRPLDEKAHNALKLKPVMPAALVEPSRPPAVSDKQPGGPAAPTPVAVREVPPPPKKLESSPDPAEPPMNLKDLERKIHWFLARYSSAYEAKNPTALFRFFETDAVENGKPIQHLVPVYQANFQRVEKLRYRIDVRKWEMGKDEVKVDGSFRLSVQFLNDPPVESTGSIQLTLIKRGDDFGVKRLDYSFKDSSKLEN
jgi:hypothetical protein